MFNKDIRKEIDSLRSVNREIVNALERADGRVKFLEREVEEAKEAINMLYQELNIGLIEVEEVPAHKEIVCLGCDECEPKVKSTNKRGRPRKNK